MRMGNELNTAARAAVVNRTHRVVRERAGMMAARRSRVRSLMIPAAVSSSLLLILSVAGWRVLEQYDLNPNGIPDASNQLFILLLWFLPVSMALLAMVLFRRIRRRVDGEVAK
ncbi:hypothetical protein [Edaphobacter acidisoli]|nr:hypothetical protein [Edaphobacter acidisoli]